MAPLYVLNVVPRPTGSGLARDQTALLLEGSWTRGRGDHAPVYRRDALL